MTTLSIPEDRRDEIRDLFKRMCVDGVEAIGISLMKAMMYRRSTLLSGDQEVAEFDRLQLHMTVMGVGHWHPLEIPPLEGELQRVDVLEPSTGVVEIRRCVTTKARAAALDARVSAAVSGTSPSYEVGSHRSDRIAASVRRSKTKLVEKLLVVPHLSY